MSLDDLNREQKRHLRRTGALDEKGAPTRVQRQAPAKRERVGPAQYLREVHDEMRKVAWPGREEVTRYSIVVVVTVIVYTAWSVASTTCSACCRGGCTDERRNEDTDCRPTMTTEPMIRRGSATTRRRARR